MPENRDTKKKRVRIDDPEELKKIEQTRLKNNLIGIAILLFMLVVGLLYRGCKCHKMDKGPSCPAALPLINFHSGADIKHSLFFYSLNSSGSFLQDIPS